MSLHGLDSGDIDTLESNNPPTPTLKRANIGRRYQPLLRCPSSALSFVYKAEAWCIARGELLDLLGAGTTTGEFLPAPVLSSSARGGCEPELRLGADITVGLAVPPVPSGFTLPSREGPKLRCDPTAAWWLFVVSAVDQLAPWLGELSVFAAPAEAWACCCRLGSAGLHARPLPRGCAGMIVNGASTVSLRLRAAFLSRNLSPVSAASTPMRFLMSHGGKL